ncbi:hypothetical protein [Halorhodospira neutriphila]|uniref:Uncharacterized protein n=1 Tax=Halorhodospira neutriphila TaxID=168379 RepID=A0ABS1E1M4_9GAMM|nr:hypothetical protein [Halorhodospira neutriphila]MBK1725691.1 hypothetical protein [Halorhodospira neutriphila]
MLVLADGSPGGWLNGRAASLDQLETHAMPRRPAEHFGGLDPLIAVARLALVRPGTVEPRRMPLIRLRQPAGTWCAIPLCPRRHRPAELITTSSPRWRSREAALRAAVAGQVREARRCCRLSGPERLNYGISRDQCRRVVAWARSVAGLPGQPAGYESIIRPAVHADGQLSLIEEV